jgi:23S rRNA pseudouridine1911/1915/1917 synthase
VTAKAAPAPRAPRAGRPAEPAERIARRLQREHPELSFTRAKHEVESGRVEVDGEAIDDPGAWVEARSRIAWKQDAPARPRERARHVEIAYADEHVVVAVKPAGLLTQPTPAREKDTLLSRVSLALARQRPDRKRARRFLASVHRLDRDTSGLVAFAVSRRALDTLQAQLEAHTMGRVYDAVVEGELETTAGTFDRALVGDGTHRRRWVAGPGETGKPAVTRWRKLHHYALATRVEVRLETGRTHQIRIHFAAAGHPVVGERVYREPRAPRFPVDFPRLALHAGELAFDHPEDGRRVVVRSPPPADYAALLERLERKRSPGAARR